MINNYQINISEQINSLNGLIKNFEYLSTLKAGANIQPTSWGNSLLRSGLGWEQNAVEITWDLGIGIYAKVTEAYSQTSFDFVIKHYSSEIYKANEVFEKTIEIIKNFDQADCPMESKIELMDKVKWAFWHLAAARIGFHEWTKTLSSKFKEEPQELEYRLKKINGIIVQENRILNKIFKECLRQFPKAINALNGNLEKIDSPKEICLPSNQFDKTAFTNVAEHMATAMQNFVNIACGFESTIEEVELIKRVQKDQLYFTKAVSEFVSVTRNFVNSLEKYEKELKSENPFFEGKLQIKAYHSLLSRGAVIREILSDIPEKGVENIVDAKELVNLLHFLFIKEEGMHAPEGAAFVAELISATIDIDMQSRAKIDHVLDQEEKKLFKESCYTLWQILAYQMVTSRFTMPINEMLQRAKNIPDMAEHGVKIQDLLDFFKLAADLANKSLK